MIRATWKNISRLIIILMSLPAVVAANPAVRISGTFDTLPPAPPYRWLEECIPGKPSIGSARHIANKLFKDLNINVEWLTGITNRNSHDQPFAYFHKKLISGELDFLITARPPAENNGLVVALDTPLFNRRSSIITLSSSTIDAQNIDLLRSYIGGAYTVPPSPSVLPSPFFNYIKKNRLNIKYYTRNYINSLNTNTSLEELLTGEIDYVIENHFRAKIWAHNNDANDKLKFTSVNLSAYDMYLLIATNSPYIDLVDNINERLKFYHTSGIVNEIHNLYLQKWLSSPCK